MGSEIGNGIGVVGYLGREVGGEVELFILFIDLFQVQEVLFLLRRIQINPLVNAPDLIKYEEAFVLVHLEARAGVLSPAVKEGDIFPVLFSLL